MGKRLPHPLVALGGQMELHRSLTPEEERQMILAETRNLRQEVLWWRRRAFYAGLVGLTIGGFLSFYGGLGFLLGLAAIFLDATIAHWKDEHPPL